MLRLVDTHAGNRLDRYTPLPLSLFKSPLELIDLVLSLDGLILKNSNLLITLVKLYLHLHHFRPDFALDEFVLLFQFLQFSLQHFDSFLLTLDHQLGLHILGHQPLDLVLQLRLKVLMVGSLALGQLLILLFNLSEQIKQHNR